MSRDEPKFCTCGSRKPGRREPCAHRVDVGHCGKLASRAHAAGEVDGEVQAAGEERAQRDDHEHRRQRVPHVARGHELEVGLMAEEFHGES